ncbi:TPA: MerR family DNA-binding transcriptional regulator, partial [Clostridioides difficile]|nr:MerR family DNA-binding transcriptional regulator [Clostridioides difficile]
MFSIGMFSKINKITTKTLRYYEDIGLLKPEYVDEFT